MRKLLGLLVAAVVVTAAAGSAMAVNLSTATPNDKTAFFSAEVFFYQTGAASFGFTLKKMAGVKPAVASDPEVSKIDWVGEQNITAGVDAFKASKVYAQITNAAYTAKTKVLFYTSNSTPTLTDQQYKYTLDTSTPAYGKGSPQTINALVEKDGATGDNTSEGFATLPLSYKVFVASTTDADGGFDYATAAVGGTVFYLTDKAKTAKPIGPGDPASDAYSDEYATISTPSGMRTWDIGFSNADVTNWYFLFASNFANARNGYSYGTDSLTVELVVEP
jgi:hypothetical protein